MMETPAGVAYFGRRTNPNAESHDLAGHQGARVTGDRVRLIVVRHGDSAVFFFFFKDSTSAMASQDVERGREIIEDTLTFAPVSSRPGSAVSASVVAGSWKAATSVFAGQQKTHAVEHELVLRPNGTYRYSAVATATATGAVSRYEYDGTFALEPRTRASETWLSVLVLTPDGKSSAPPHPNAVGWPDHQVQRYDVRWEQHRSGNTDMAQLVLQRAGKTEAFRLLRPLER